MIFFAKAKQIKKHRRQSGAVQYHISSGVFLISTPVRSRRRGTRLRRRACRRRCGRWPGLGRMCGRRRCVSRAHARHIPDCAGTDKGGIRDQKRAYRIPPNASNLAFLHDTIGGRGYARVKEIAATDLRRQNNAPCFQRMVHCCVMRKKLTSIYIYT